MSVSGTATAKVGRNDACPCGSGRKFKHCCEAKEAAAASAGTAKASTTSQARAQRLQALLLAAKKHRDAGRWADAAPPLREYVRLDPNNAQAHHDLGLTYLRSGRPAEAAASLQRALDLRPGFDSALRHLVEALELEGREAEALLACRKLSRKAGNPLERRHYLAKALVMEGNPAEAETELRRLLVIAPELVGTRVLLGQLLARRGMFEEAANHLTRVVEVAPGAFQQLTAVKRMTEADRPLLERMRGLAEKPGLDVMQCSGVHFGLGKSYNDLREHAEAMRHYQAGNQLRAMSARLNRTALAAQHDGIIKRFSAEALALKTQSLAMPARAGDDLPVLIVGMPRSGTTLIEQILSSHPAVAAGGELSFWQDRVSGWRASGMGTVDAAALSKARQDYLAELRQIGPEALRVTDKAPFNFELLWLIRLAFPEARIIHCRRSPVDTCLSIFFMNFAKRQDYAWDRGDLVFYYRQYERLMEHWRGALPADRFAEVEYETLVVNPEAETRRLIAFCGLDWSDACLAPEQNARVVKTASLWQARQPVYKTSVERWRRYEPWLGELRELLPAVGAGPQDQYG